MRRPTAAVSGHDRDRKTSTSSGETLMLRFITARAPIDGVSSSRSVAASSSAGRSRVRSRALPCS